MKYPARMGLFTGIVFSFVFAFTITARAGVSFDDIQLWAGTGSNRAAMVIDWNDDIAPVSLVWGYRWDGATTGEDMLKAVLEADDRLFANLEYWESMGGSATVYGLGYDVDKDGFSYVPGTGGALHLSNDDGHAEDANDHYKEGWMTAGYWSYYLSSDNGENWDYSGVGMSLRTLSDGDVDGWSFSSFAGFGAGGLPDTPVAAEAPQEPSPFAVEVVDFSGPFGDGAYSYPEALLGKPATHIKDGAGATSRIKLVEPAYIYGLEGEPLVTTLNEGSFITVKFDHKVMDDPLNPYGIDFIVFGNSFFTAASNGWISDGTNMNEVLLAGGGWFEKVKVSVSQDGVNWYRYDNGPYGDGMFPTQAYQWDAESATWTDNEMDWTRPVNPKLIAADFTDITAADAIKLFNGSAGGTGFDLTESGLQWIQYIKVEGLEGAFGGGEIDAFADVAPLQVKQSDFNQDGKLDLGDAVLGLQMLAGINNVELQGDLTDIIMILRVMTGAN